jgi:fumarylacetoacetase
MNKTNHPELRSWIEVPEGSDFPLQNLPFGIFRRRGKNPRAATRIGDFVIDLYALATHSCFTETDIDPEVFNRPVLNDLIAKGKPAWQKLRSCLSDLFNEESPNLRDNLRAQGDFLFPAGEVEMLMPVGIGDYTDFYSSMQHAVNLGTLYRGAGHALNPNWKSLPVAYHGRSSSIVVSGTPIHRPNGQFIPEDATAPVFGPTQQLDFELEVAFIAGKSTPLGTSITTREAEDHIFGLVLFNDLSARDIQRWEYVPLGPFAGKNFGSVISPWIVTLDALEPFRVAGPVQDPPVLPNLAFDGDYHYDIRLEVFLQPLEKKETLISSANYNSIYWNMVQQLAHQAANGCNIRIGDLYASGAISGPGQGSYGSMIELTRNGEDPLRLPDGSLRRFLEDTDTVIIRGHAEKNGLRIGFGEASVTILPPNT